VPPTFISGAAPGALPLVGHAWPLTRRPVDFFASLPAYGDLVEIRLGPSRAYVPCHPELLRRILLDDRTFDKGGPFYGKAREFFGNSIGMCPHADHRRQRRLLQPAFHRHRLESYASVMEQEIADLTGSWRDGQCIDVYPAMKRLTLRTVIRTLFSTHADADTVEGIRHAFETVLDGFLQWLFLPEALRRLPLPANRRHRRAMAYLHGTVNRIIGDYRRDGEDHGDLLSILITARDDEGAGLDDTEIQEQVIAMLTGGSETVAITLTWALYALSRHPDVHRRLQEEVDAVLGGRPAQWSDLPALDYTERVIRETLRIDTPGWLFARMTTRPVQLDGVRLPAGAVILVSPPAVHRNTDVYRRPLNFDPDRWLPESRSALPPGAFTAFSAGARRCIGDVYGMVEATMALATITSRWDIACAPGTDLRPKPLVAIHYPRRLNLRVTRRAARLEPQALSA
jgi:pentalenene oxygenase